jgi:TRAP-type C4-dicarboxylate transport system permease small subunit
MVLARLRRSAELAAAVLFATMFGAFVIQVVSRYVFDAPVSWTLEICSITYVWIVFFAAGTIVTYRQHITFDMLYGLLTARGRRAAAIFTTASVLVIFTVCLPQVLDYIRFVSRMHTLVLKIRLDLIYSCFAIFMIGAILGAASRLWRLLSRDWHSSV